MGSVGHWIELIISMIIFYKCFIPLKLYHLISSLMGIYGEFMDFLREYKVIGLAIAFIMGLATTVLVQSLVNNIIMPVALFFIPGGNWEQATLTIGTIVIRWGAFLSSLVYFIILALVVFLLAKKVIHEEKVTNK